MTLPFLLPLSAAADVSVRVVDPTGAPLLGTIVVAEPLAAASPTAAQAVRVPALRGLATLPLGPGVWRLTGRCEGRWGWSREVTVRSGARESLRETLELWPVGRVGGALVLPRGAPYPEEVAVRLRPDTPPDSWGRTLTGDVVSCPVREGRWECEVPAGLPLDLELRVEPFAPRYFWGQRVGEDEPLDTGSTRLVQGASLSGWVLRRDGQRPAAPARVELRIPGTVVLGSDTREAGPEASAHPRGFFQLVNVSPGRYQLAASADTFQSPVADVEVREGMETRLAYPLLLDPPAALSLSLIPARHPDGGAWLVRLMAAQGSPGRFVVWGEEVSEDGAWRRSDLPAGEYQLTITREDGGTWYADHLELEPGADDVELQIEMTRLSGRVRIGESPLADAEVMIADREGKVRAPFRTDDEGRFGGVFPAVDLERARWHARVETAEPRRDWSFWSAEPETTVGSSLTFALEIADTSIRGKVVNEAGAPQRAVVAAMPQTESEGAVLLDTSTDETTGEFELPGVVPGEYQVFARAPAPGDEPRTLQSPATAVHVGETDSPPPVVLVVTDQTQISGRVTTSEGVPVPGAQVIVFSMDHPATMARPARTDVGGHFVARTFPGTRNVLIDVSAIGVGRRFMGRSISGDHRVDIELDQTGRLVFDLGSPEQAGPPMALVFHDGGWVPLADLARWGQRHGEATEPGVIGVPLIHAGPYRVCQVSSGAESHSLRAGTLPEPRCDEGTLWPGGELWLSVPEAAP